MIVAVVHTPDRVADIIGDQQSAAAIHFDIGWPAVRLPVLKEARHEVLGDANRARAMEDDERNLVAMRIDAISAAVLSVERIAAETLREAGASAEGQPERRPRAWLEVMNRTAPLSPSWALQRLIEKHLA